ncbi:protein TIC 55, chloroplastic-like [Wolffia australiana]
MAAATAAAAAAAVGTAAVGTAAAGTAAIFLTSYSSSSSSRLPVLRAFPLRQSPIGGDRRRRRDWRRRVSPAEILIPSEESAADPDPTAEIQYDWTQEWYPLYLTANLPDDAPLGLTVFDKQLVVYKDGGGVIRCYEDRCPHRLAKLSEGQIVDGKLECLYHGWQFQGSGECVKIPQLPEGAKIPRAACAKPYEVRDSQGVLWVWMSPSTPPAEDKLPWFEHYARPGFSDVSTIHDLPYDHSILLENLMDPAHVPISHDRTDWTAKREHAQPLVFSVTERSLRGFAGTWRRNDRPTMVNNLRFSAPCVLQNNLQFVDAKGKEQFFSALFLCRPTGQGRSMLIVRFGNSLQSPLLKILPKWYMHQNAGKVFEQDMGFLSSQNEILMRERKPTKDLYLNLRSSDTWVAEYRRWMDRVGHGMPYYFGHQSLSLPKEAAVVEQMPAGAAAAAAAGAPAKGGVGDIYAANPVNRYLRHIVHCKSCRTVVKRFEAWKKVLAAAAVAAAVAAVMVETRRWKAVFLGVVALCSASAWGCAAALGMITTNFVRVHRRL